MWRNFKYHYNRLTYKNLSTRKYINDQSGNLSTPRRTLLASVFDTRNSISENLAKIMYAPQRSLHNDKEFRFFSELYELNEIEDKRNTVIFIENKHGLHSNFSCNAIPFVVPALTGIATIHGIPYDYCPATDYGFDQFALESRTEIGKINSIDDLCTEAEKAGTEHLIILNYDNYSVDLNFVNCNTIHPLQSKN